MCAPLGFKVLYRHRTDDLMVNCNYPAGKRVSEALQYISMKIIKICHGLKLEGPHCTATMSPGFMGHCKVL